MSFLAKVSPIRLLRRASTRVINIESIPAFDKYDHLSNMESKDLFQFEPFNNEDQIPFPREQPGKDYDLNWSLANEWFTVWGNAYRNPDRSLLLSHLKCVRDMCGNAFCKRTFVSDCDVPTLTTNFEELSDEVKEFLSKVPNLYVEDAAVCSGKLLETRIRSVTNDPATALLLKNMLHRMPLRHPQTPHPLSLIVARGLSHPFTAIGEDLHSRSLTVLIAGDVSPHRILDSLATATAHIFDAERGIVEMAPSESNTPPIKGPISKCILPCCTCLDAQGDVKLAFGAAAKTAVTALTLEKRLFCDGNTVLAREGVSRVFAGVCCEGEKLEKLEKLGKPGESEMVLNQEVYRAVEGDNLLVMPNEVFFVENEDEERTMSDGEEILERLGKYIGNSEYAAFAMERLQNAVFRTIHGDSLEKLLK